MLQLSTLLSRPAKALRTPKQRFLERCDARIAKTKLIFEQLHLDQQASATDDLVNRHLPNPLDETIVVLNTADRLLGKTAQHEANVATLSPAQALLNS